MSEAVGEDGKKGMSRTRKLGRRLSRSMSIVALKLPEKAHNITRKSSKLMRVSSRDKKTRSFDVSIILPDKTQRQITVMGGSTVSEAISEVLRELGTALAGTISGPLSAPQPLALGAPLPPPPRMPPPPAALLYLGDCRAPVDGRAPAAGLEGEVLLVETQPPVWDGADLQVFIAWEKIYASTLLSAVELYGKPLLRACAITNEEYHLLFYYLRIVSEASTALAERMQSYLESGLLKNCEESLDDGESNPRSSSIENDQQSILSELVQEGFLRQKDLEISSEADTTLASVRSDSRVESKSVDECDSAPTGVTRVHVESMYGSEVAHSICDTESHFDEGRATEVSIVTVGGQCCTDHRICSDVQENVWANVRWNFLNPVDYGYDSIRSVKRSQSESALTPRISHKSDRVYEVVVGDDEDEEAMTPYESIEDIYDCIKNPNYNKSEDSTPSTESRSEPQYPESVSTRQSSSENSMVGSEYISRLFPRRASTPPPPPPRHSESTILLTQLFSGELKDAYSEFLSAYPHARALLRRKIRHDEHFHALVDHRKGVAKYGIVDYLELPIERLAQYERLATVARACGRRRGARLSDLERIQDLFPHDYLALHDHDALATQLATNSAQKTKSLRKRPSLDLNGSGTGTIRAASPTAAPRTFVMEAPVALRALAPEGAPTLDRHLFLFSDVLLVGKSRGTNCFKLKESVRLSEAWLALPEGDDTGFLIGWPSAPPAATPLATYLASYPTQAARDSWYRKIQNALNTQLATEPKSTNIQVVYKDPVTTVEFCKTLAVTPEMTTSTVTLQALQVLQSNNVDGSSAWGQPRDFVLCARTARDATPAPLNGIERPHAIQMSRIRQTLSSEDGFDLEHVNSKKNPCGLVFELRKKNNGLKNTTSPGVGGRGLRLLRRGGASTRLFGVALTRLNGGAPPPLVIQMLKRLRIDAPNTHGVFRRSANIKALRNMKDKLDSLGGACTSCPELDREPTLLLAALVKDFFRSLPQPLLGEHLYHDWISVLSLSASEKMSAVRSLLHKLPQSHYTMITYFVCLLQAIAKKHQINYMCPTNLGVCVGPSLLWPSAPCDKAPKAVPTIIEFLITKAEALFGPQIGNLLGTGSPDSSAALLDSGAEESDSLHSVGISLDSMELSSPRKEKLSLSRDSGLTLSEDDSNSNGGNSPAPRNAVHSLSAPAAARSAPRHASPHNVNGLPHVERHYANKSEIYNAVREEFYSAPYANERYVHATIEVGTDRTYERAPRRTETREDTYGQVPKYVTGLEPQKPPRSNVSKAARTSKVYSMFSENTEQEESKPFNRAKSSDNLLDFKQTYDGKLASSQENMLYDDRRQNAYRNAELSNTIYSRVYTDWEKRSAAYSHTSNTASSRSSHSDIYGTRRPEEKKRLAPDATTNGSAAQAATIFVRNDWTRQAARTKSSEGGEETYVSKCGEDTVCHRRQRDPAHLCSSGCTLRAAEPPPLQNSCPYVDAKKRHRCQEPRGRIAHSKSLANVTQSDSSSSDTLYPGRGSPFHQSADSSFDAHYAQYEPLYQSIYGRRRDHYRRKEDEYSSEIYTAKPSRVEAEKEEPKHHPPPVPPRKLIYQKVVKKTSSEADEKRSKTVPPYREPPAEKNDVIALHCSDTESESESYV